MCVQVPLGDAVSHERARKREAKSGTRILACSLSPCSAFRNFIGKSLYLHQWLSLFLPLIRPCFFLSLSPLCFLISIWLLFFLSSFTHISIRTNEVKLACARHTHKVKWMKWRCSRQINKHSEQNECSRRNARKKKVGEREREEKTERWKGQLFYSNVSPLPTETLIEEEEEEEKKKGCTLLSLQMTIAASCWTLVKRWCSLVSSSSSSSTSQTDAHDTEICARKSFECICSVE